MNLKEIFNQEKYTRKNNGFLLSNESIILLENIKEDMKEKLQDLYDDYWKESYEGDKFKRHITCDELDYLVNKHFGSVIKIDTLQELENGE